MEWKNASSAYSLQLLETGWTPSSDCSSSWKFWFCQGSVALSPYNTHEKSENKKPHGANEIWTDHKNKSW
jgi:hypothetical protein